MRQLSNGYGGVGVEGGRVYGFRGGQLIGDMPLPLDREDALMFLELCMSPEPGSGTFCPGFTASIFVRDVLTKKA